MVPPMVGQVGGEVRAWLERRLEAGLPAPPFRWAARGWDLVAERRIRRHLPWDGTGVVLTVGGATLGGGGKTPLALACAQELSAWGHAVAFVGHGYRARPAGVHVVTPGDPVARVGDEALAASWAVAGPHAPGGGVSVVVAPTRQEAFLEACRLHPIRVLDGPLQIAPRPASLALLALSAEAPWGAGHGPPAGDRRVPPGAALGACDLAVVLHDEATPAPDLVALLGAQVPAVTCALHLPGVRLLATDSVHPLNTPLVGWEAVRGLRVGVATGIARPQRLLAMLARRGIVPLRIAAGSDHCPPDLSTVARVGGAVDLWLTTGKCAAHWVGDPRGSSVPLATVELRIALPQPLVRTLKSLAAGGISSP